MGNSSSKAILYQVKSPVISVAKGRMGSDISESACETSEVYLQLICQTICWTEGTFCDLAKMVRTDPSCNTDQGVYHICEFASEKTHRHTERKCKMRIVTEAASTDLDLLRRVRVRAYLVGPERW